MKKILFTILTAIFAFSVQAQALRTSYFMETYTLRHMRNPAMSPMMGYVSFGNLNLALQTNMSLSNYLYPGKNGKVLTFMHEDVSSKQFLNNIGNREHIGADAMVNVLGIGFYTNRNSFWSFDLNVRANAGAGIPKDFFATLKELHLGVGKTYDWSNFNVAGRGYVELAFGHARDITENIRVGAKLKPLIGIADARLKFDDVPFHTEEWIYTLRTKASASALGNFVQIHKKSDGSDSITFGAPDDLMDFIGGYGIALDLGVSYNLDNLLENTLGALVPFSLKGFTASFGITDIGFIRYKKAEQMTFDKTFVWEGGLISTGDELFNIDEFTDQLEDLLDNFIHDGNAKRARGLRTTTNTGLEYSFLNNKMSAGLLWSAHWGLPRVFNEWTLSYNLRPTNWFALTLSTSVAHGFFRSAGWAINLTPKYGLALFVGMDYVPLFYTPKIDNMRVMWNEINLGLPIGLPIYSTNINFNFGLSVPLGGNRHHKFPSRREQKRMAGEAAVTDDTAH
jgi:hypothetical protein